MTPAAATDTTRYGYAATLADIITLAVAGYFLYSAEPNAADDYGRFALMYVCIDALALLLTATAAVAYAKHGNASGLIGLALFVPFMLYKMQKVLPHEGYWPFVAALCVSIVLRAATTFKKLPANAPNSDISGYLAPVVGPVLVAMPVAAFVAIYSAISNQSGASDFIFLLLFYIVHALLSLPPAQRWFEQWAYRWYG